MVVPLDCEWVWHCHRLNPVCSGLLCSLFLSVLFIQNFLWELKDVIIDPLIQVRYKADCEKFYGSILDNCNVVSSVQEVSGKETEEIWSKLYPNEPYVFDLTRGVSDDTLEKSYETENQTTYDLVSAIERQSPFFYQVTLRGSCTASYWRTSKIHFSNSLNLS